MNRRHVHKLLLGAGTIAAGSLLSGCRNTMKPENLNEKPYLQSEALNAGRAALRVNPSLGGSLLAFDIDDVPILRPTPTNSSQITETASFPLIPIVNRIPNGEFFFEDRYVHLEGNFMGLPDFIHGHGWRSHWNLVEKSEDRAVLEFEHEAGDWPWRYLGKQVLDLRDNGFRQTLSVRNMSDSNMPAALGFHPYFPVTEYSRLQFDFEGHWINNDRGHAIRQQVGPSRKDFSAGADMIDTVMTDATHYGWNGTALLRETGRPDITITASPKCPNLHIFFPPDANFVAIEPTSGRSNPFNVAPIEYETLEPGEKFEVWMDVAVDDVAI